MRPTLATARGSLRRNSSRVLARHHGGVRKVLVISDQIAYPTQLVCKQS